MPAYDYRCNACQRRVTLTYKTYADYDEATPVCTYCGSSNLARLISRVAIKKSPISRFMSGGISSDDDALSELDSADPATMGRVLREMSAEVGEDVGDDFNEVVERLERGESPEDIESSLPPMSDDAAPPSGPPALPSLGDE